MFLPQHGILGNPSQYFSVMIIGDSVARGNSTAVGNTPPHNSTFQWDAGNSNLRMITNLDLLEPVAASAIGSQWPQFGASLYQYTGGRRKAVMINCAIGGSSWDNASNTPFSWYTNGTLYSDAVTKTQNALTFLGHAKPDVVYINLGINDSAQQSYTLNVNRLTSLIDRINTDFDTPRICVSMPGKLNIATLNELTRIRTMCKFIKSLHFTYSNVEICGSMSNMTAWNIGGTLFNDDFHLTKLGNDLLGDKLARQIAIPATTYRKYTRSLIGNLYDNTSSARREFIDTWVADMEGASLLTELDVLHVHADMNTGNRQNGFIDWGFITTAAEVNNAVYDYSGVDLTAASSQRISSGQPSVFMDNAIMASDFICGTFIDTNSIAAGTVATLFGVRESASGGIILLRQTAANVINFFAGSTTSSTNGAETAFANNAHYALARSAGDQILIKDGSIVQTSAAAAVAPSATVIRSLAIGAYNFNGTVADYFDGKLKATYVARYSTWNISTFNTIMNNFFTNWLTTTP
jgi:hypothetical protein